MSSSSSSSYPDGIVQGLVELNRLMLHEESLEATLARITKIATIAIEGSDLCGITLIRDGGMPTTAAFTDPAAPEIDSAQYESGSGPCLDAYRFGNIMRWNAGRNDNDWPEFAASAKNHGVHSSLSMPLASEGGRIGALNVYAKTEDAFPESDEPLATMFAEQISVACANAQVYWRAYELTQNLQEALRNRDVIGQAKGILISQSQCTEDEAFDLLRRASQRENRKLHDIAAEIVARAQTPPD
jgi:GAF domain-containing protein